MFLSLQQINGNKKATFIQYIEDNKPQTFPENQEHKIQQTKINETSRNSK